MATSAEELRTVLERYVETSEGEYKQVNRAKNAAMSISNTVAPVNSSLKNQWSDVATVTEKVISAACSNLELLDAALGKFIADTIKNEEVSTESAKRVSSELDEIANNIAELQ